MLRKSQKDNLRPSYFEGRYSYAVSTTAFSAFAFNPNNLDDRAIAMADLFGQWRLKDLRIQVITREATYVHLGVLVNEYHASPPTTVEELQDLPYYMEGSGIYGAPLPSIHVTNKDVKKLIQLKWYNTNTASAENEFEFFGNVYTYAPFATLNYDVVVTYCLEFGAPMDPAQALSSPQKDLNGFLQKRLAMRQGIASPPLSARRSAELKGEELKGVLPTSGEKVTEEGAVLVRPLGTPQGAIGSTSKSTSARGVVQGQTVGVGKFPW